MLVGKDGLRLWLAGAQDKLPVIFDGDRIGLPRNGTPSSHILKAAIRSLADTVINEGFCLASLSASRVTTPSARRKSAQHKPRISSGTAIARIPPPGLSAAKILTSVQRMISSSPRITR